MLYECDDDTHSHQSLSDGAIILGSLTIAHTECHRPFNLSTPPTTLRLPARISLEFAVSVAQHHNHPHMRFHLVEFVLRMK